MGGQKLVPPPTSPIMLLASPPKPSPVRRNAGRAWGKEEPGGARDPVIAHDIAKKNIAHGTCFPGLSHPHESRATEALRPICPPPPPEW